MPTKPNHGELFILDSKATKRKWKQDGWTYLPRKQGVGFREDNENLRIGGENAITCYYSYIISGLLEGEEKTILMNRRIYKLFPEGQYFLVHYLSDSSIEQPPAKEIKSNEEEISQRVRSEDSQNSIAQSNQLFHSNEIKSDSVNQHQVFPQYSDESSYYSVPTQQAGKSNSDTKAELISQRQNSHEGKSSSTDEAASQDVHIDEEKEFQQLEILNGVNNECNLNNNHNNVSMFPNTYEYNNNNYDLWNNPHNAEKKKYQSDQQDMFSCINNYSELPAFCGTSGNNDGQSCEDNYPYTFYTGQSQHITCCNPHAGGDPIKMEFKENLMSFANSLSSQNMNYQNDHMLSNNGNIMSLHPSYQQPLSLLDGDQSSKIVNINEQQQYFNGNELQQHEQSNGNNQPSYSKLQERIVELEQRLMKLEFDKKSLQQSEINNSKISGDIPYFEHQQQQQYNGGMILSEQSSIQTITSASNQPLFQYQQNQFRLNNESDLQIQDTVIFNHGITQPHYNENKNLEQIDVSLVSQVDSSSNSLLMQQQQRQVPNEDNPNNSQPKQKPQIKVTEYSPEWDYTKGGSKMVLCFLPVLSELSDDERGTFQIGFGVQKVPAYCIQPGVLKCFVPPQEKGLVKLSIFLSDQRVDDVLDKTNYFEYRSQEKKKKPKQNVKRIVFNQEDELYRNEFKVRIIDKLNSISEFINQSGSKSSSTSKQSKISKINESVITETPQKATETPQKSTEIPQKVSETPPQNLNQIEDLLLNELKMDINKLDKSSFEKILKKVLQVADGKLKKNQIKKWLDEVDENGYGLIHYVIILGFDTTLPILIEQDCNLRLQSKNSITPLELALALNQEKTAEILIKNGVLETRMGEDRQSQEGDNRGENDSHKILNFNDIFKSRNILDMLVREVTLHDSINNSSFNEHMSWNDQDQEEDNYFELKDLCESTNEKDMIQAQLRQLGKKLASCSLKDGRLFSEDDDDEEDEEEDEDEDDDEEDDEEEEEEGDEDQFNSQLNNWQRQLVNANKDKDKKIRKTLSHDNIDKIQNKKHKYLRNYSELKIKTKKVKQQQNKQEDNQSEQIGLGFQDMSDEMYQNSNYQCRIKTIQKNVRGWLLRRQYLDIKYATRVLQNYIRQKIAKKHIKPECKSMIKNKLIDWLSIKH